MPYAWGTASMADHLGRMDIEKSIAEVLPRSPGEGGFKELL